MNGHFLTQTSVTVLFLLLLITGLIAAPGNNHYIIKPINRSYTLILMIVIAVAMGLFPIELGSDKSNYAMLFYQLTANIIDFEKDVGWLVYTKLCSLVSFGNVQIYFLITSLLYTTGYYIFARHYINTNYIWYFMLMTFGCLGFWSGGTNIMRAGLATSIIMAALAVYKRKVPAIILFLIALTIHKSMVIIIIAFLLSKYHPKPKHFIVIWVCAFILSSLNLTSSIQNYINNLFGSVDNRVSEYLVNEDDSVYDIYKSAGFRIDFIIYSLIPIIAGYRYIFKYKFRDSFYCTIYSTYLLANSLWVIIIRIPYGDRFALLSWTFIPFIILYPLLSQKLFKRQSLRIILYMTMFMGINLILTLK